MKITAHIRMLEADDKLGLFEKRYQNRLKRWAIEAIARDWRNLFYWKRFVPRIVYLPPFKYQWGTHRTRRGQREEVPIAARTPLYHTGAHRSLYPTGNIKGNSRAGNTWATVALPFGHPIPKKVRGSSATNEIQSLSQYVPPSEVAWIAKKYAEKLAAGAQNLQTRGVGLKRPPVVRAAKRPRTTIRKRA